LDVQPSRNLGAVYTPPDVAQLPASWAIQDKKQKVLDIGVGEGVFTFAAFNRLLELGASSSAAQNQIFGAEIYLPAFENFKAVSVQMGVDFSNVYFDDFFNISFPDVDAVIGNPPWVRRSDLNNVDGIRDSVLRGLDSLDEQEVTRLTDLYVYFLLKAATHLKANGKLAVITADSWLNARYGLALKEYLQEHFVIESLMSLDRQIFNAQVKSVLLFATKKSEAVATYQTRFIRVRNGLPTAELLQILHHPRAKKLDVDITVVKSKSLTASHPWGVHFKAPEVCERIAANELMTPLREIASTRIGIQTLAKEFFVLTPQGAREKQVEKKYLEPLAQSSRYIRTPVIEESNQVAHFLFHCARAKKDIVGTGALRHIEAGERQSVRVRGKNVTVRGYQNKERIKHANRPHWYDLATDIKRRGRWDILIPRLIYRSFNVIWNKAKVVPGELFIECSPKKDSKINIEVYLAILISSLTEVQLRSYAQLYGGGTTNISPGEIKKLPVINVSMLTSAQLLALEKAYLSYLADPSHDRNIIDEAVFTILGIDEAFKEKIRETLLDLVSLAATSKKRKKNKKQAKAAHPTLSQAL
jgi:methylase of polypeptide subunit release factors